MRFVTSEAWQGDCLKIKPSWTKGDIGRTLEITNEEQRQWIAKTMQHVPKGHSLVPQNRTYKQHLRHYQVQTQNIGINKCHGLRHAYAQIRYLELTRSFDVNGKGLICPIDGGKPSKYLRGKEREWNIRAREVISRELGHSRLAITKVYLG